MKKFIKKGIAVIICVCMFFGATHLEGTFSFDYEGFRAFAEASNNIPTREGYKFAGYAENGEPRWEAIAYSIYFNANGGYFESTSECEEILCACYGSRLMQPEEIPVRPGYIFNGWTLSGSKELETFPILIPAKNLYYEANWAQDLSFCTVKEVRKESFIQDKQLGFYSVTVHHEPNKVQILSNSSNFELDLVYDRNDELVSENLVQPGLVSIKAFDYHHNEVELGSDDVIYEVWTVAAELEEGEYLVRCQRESGDWEFLEYSYQYIMVYDEIPDGTFCGKLESSEMINDLDDGGSWVYKMVVDGIEYDVKENLIPNSIKDVEGQDVVFTVENGEVVWFSTVWDLVQKINCNLVVTDEITYSGKKYSTDEIDARVDIKYSYKSKNIEELKAISELGVAVSGVKLKSSNPDLLNFDGKAETMVLFNDIVPIGGSASKAVTINVDSSYKISDLIENEVVSITCDMSAAGDGKLIEKALRVKNITVVNKNYEKPVIEEPDEPIEPDKIDTSKLAQNAGNILKNNFQGAAAGLGADSYLYEILTVEQLQAIGNMLICEAAMASAEKDSFSEGTISDALFEKVFNFKKNIYMTQREISVTVVVEPPKIDGDLKIKFTCTAEEWGLVSASSTIHGNVNYEIIGGKGSKHIPKDKKEGLAGGLYVANVKSFCEAAWALAEAELKNAYNIAWGDDVNSAVDLIFGKCVNKILKAANLDSVSGLTWKLITIPAASVKIECPVDVYVYNSNNELVAAVEDNEVILTDDKAQITVNGDTKYVTLFDESYYIVYEATADGMMRVTVNEHANSEDILRTVVIDEIPLESGAVFSQNIDGKILEESNYSITADDETVYTPDSDETTFHYHETDGEWFEGKAVECTEDGWNYTQCNICGDWYKEIILFAGHKDEDNNGYCDECKDLIWQTITWNVDGAETTAICKEGAEITLPETPKKIGYSFAGWTPQIPDAMPAEDLTFTATWTANSYNAVFDANGGKWADGAEKKTVPADFNAEIKAPENPVNQGYIFSCWSPEVGVMDDVNGKKFTAQWLAATDTRYTVETYTMNTSGEYEKSVLTMSGTTDSTVNADYTIETGFALNKEKSVLSGTVAADNSLVLKVYIDRNTYVFETIVDAVSTETEYLYGAMIAEPATPVKADYKFIEWNTKIPETMPAEDVTVTAVFEKSYICPDCGNEILGEAEINAHIASEARMKATVKIQNNNGEKTINYGETLKLTAVTDGKPADAIIVWYVDGVRKGVGETYSVTFESGTKTVEVKLEDTSGKVLKDASGNEIKDSEKVSVNDGFWQKIVSFFKNLFRINRTVEQTV